MQRIIFILIAIVATLLSTPAWAECSAGRPCGPESLKGPLAKLIPQGVFGADFKPGCRRHDRCYGTLGSDKDACDARFLSEMQCACKQSKHPTLCRAVARLMYLSLRTEASVKAFTRGQRLASHGR